ncbi:MAG: SDR family NAD(P)-dependent oxidoreductase [Magnetococcales bacterium]|nr:SDR family NAD(P)-dependent oxidoreductase [Magnetococcales bacterium]
MSEDSEQTVHSKLLLGIKASLILLVVSPFLVALLPLWVIHASREKRLGRKPVMPLRMLIQYIRRGRQERPLFTYEPAEEGVPPSVSTPVEIKAQASESLSEQPIVKKTDQLVETTSQITGLTGVALVTGGSHRLGRMICETLAESGLAVAVGYYNSKKEAESVAAGIEKRGGKAAAFKIDLNMPALLESTVNEVARSLGPITVLINNASVFLPTPIENPNWEVMERQFRINLMAPLWLGLKVGGLMGEQGGCIVNIGDIWGQRPLKDYATYSTTQAGMTMVTQTLARELAPAVRVNGIAPGGIIAPDDVKGAERYRVLLSRTPLAAQAGPDDVLALIRTFLTTSYLTGCIIPVDGGRSLV